MSKKITFNQYFIFSLAVIIIFIAIFSNYLMPYEPNEMNLDIKLQGSSLSHLLGTDHLGRDIFSRILHGASVSLGSVFVTLVLILTFGVGIGGLAGFVGGKIDQLLMRICDMFMSFPTTVLALFFVGILGSGIENVIIAIALTHWAWYARVVRSVVLSLKNREFVLISRVSGASFLQSFKENMLVPIVNQCTVLATLDIGHIMLHISALSFLGLGVMPPQAEWGIMISDAREYIWTQPELVLWPGLALFITVMTFNMLGDILRDKLDTTIGLDSCNE